MQIKVPVHLVNGHSIQSQTSREVNVMFKKKYIYIYTYFICRATNQSVHNQSFHLSSTTLTLNVMGRDIYYEQQRHITIKELMVLFKIIIMHQQLRWKKQLHLIQCIFLSLYSAVLVN